MQAIRASVAENDPETSASQEVFPHLYKYDIFYEFLLAFPTLLIS